MRFLKENDNKLKIYEITYGTDFGDDADSYDVEYDRDFPGYTIVYAENEDVAEKMFYKEFNCHEILSIYEIDEEKEKEVRSRVDFVDFYK